MAKRIGIFGGSFDPVHLGHLWIAEAAREQLNLDEVRWIPAATSPLKRSGPVASDGHRLQMLRLAISGHPQFVVDERELVRGDVSYTVDTLAALKEEFPEDDFFLIIGSDSLATLERWHQPSRLLGLADLAVIQRGGDRPIDFSILQSFTDATQIERLRRLVIAMPMIELSSSEIRERVAQGRSIRYRVPASVQALIQAESLYR